MTAIRKWLDEYYAELLVMDGLDEAIIGLGEQSGGTRAVVYDYEKIIECLMGQGMTREVAIEFADFNIVDAHVGEATPIILYRPDL
jgi:hypothetical protein